MTNQTTTIDPEPPLIAWLGHRLLWLKRTLWIKKKVLGPQAYKAMVAQLAGVLLIGLNPLTSVDALAAAGPANTVPTLSDFSFSSYEEVTLAQELATTQEEGYALKPLVINTEVGRPEKELKERERKMKEARLAAAARETATRRTSRSTAPQAQVGTPTNEPAFSAGNTYAYGYCTWWAKSKRPDLPNHLGNAKNWLGSAKAQGLPTGSSPQVGAIVVTTESALGHVGYVEAVEGSEIVVSDMNMIGWGKVSKRRMSTSAGVIRGYIY